MELEHTEIAAGHLVERFRLFFIIMLGETVLTTGNAFAGEPFTLERLLALAIGFAGTVALWWCYFQRVEGIAAQAAAHDEDAGAIGLWGTWTLTLIVLALIAIAVADELAIAHPADDTTFAFTVLAFGGPALFLLAQLLFQRAALGRAPRSRGFAIAALAVLAAATAPLSLIAGIGAASAVLIVVAITDTVGV
jgi:low temperature requirement protein LtrA